MLKDMPDAYGSQYAQLYSVVTRHKDYHEEVGHLMAYLTKAGIYSSDKLLSIGCGIGTHERLLADHFSEVHAYDQSIHMIGIAKEQKDHQNLYFYDDISFLVNPKSYGVAISLFNVVNCIETNSELLNIFQRVCSSLKERGMFLFECWNSRVIQQDPPTIVTRNYQSADYDIKRQATPNWIDSRKINIEYHITGSYNSEVVDHLSTHTIYLHEITTVCDLLRESGFSNIRLHNALSSGLSMPDKRSRMICISASS